MPNFNLSKKIRKSSFQVLQILAIFWNLIALTLGYNSVKSLRVTKIVKKKKKKIEGIWGKLDSKKVSRNNNSQNISETNSSFHVK